MLASYAEFLLDEQAVQQGPNATATAGRHQPSCALLVSMGLLSLDQMMRYIVYRSLHSKGYDSSALHMHVH